MRQYHKIQTVFKRNPDDNYKTLLREEYSMPEFKMLKDIIWVGTEKIDGTNIRIIWDNGKLYFKGKTDKANIPKHLLEKLEELFTEEKLISQFGNESSVCLYGEGYGVKIQKGGNYIPNDTDFILFDCKINGIWLERENVEGIGKQMEINVVPIAYNGGIEQAVELVKNGFVSLISHNRNYIAEGLILKPEKELFDRRGNRIITKIKHKDF
jgi:hypothetical protein